jgi:hypothetical protein
VEGLVTEEVKALIIPTPEGGSAKYDAKGGPKVVE